MWLPPARAAAAGGHAAQVRGRGLQSGPQPAPRPGAAWERGKARDPSKSRCLLKSSNGRVKGKRSRSLWIPVVRKGLQDGLQGRASRAPHASHEGIRRPPLSFPAQEGSVSPSPTEEERGESFCQLQRGYLLRALSTNCWNRLIV